MSVPKTILNELKSVLAADATLKAYVQRVDLGLRRGLPKQEYPCIQLEPGALTETYEAFPKVEAHLLVHVIAYTHVFNLDTLLVGDANYKGVLELELDIKKALGAKFPTLNGTLLEFTFPRTEFGISESTTEFPVRSVTMDVDCHYQTMLDTRT